MDDADSSQRPRLAIDLFAGAGGASLGLVQSGIEVLAAVECDPDAARTYRANHPRVELLEHDIRTLDPLALLTKHKLAPGDIHVLNSCPPCQGFSSLHRGTLDEERNDLVLETWRWVNAIRPRMVVLENVRYLRADRRYIKLIEHLEDAGYTVKDWVLDAFDLGAPQHRMRLFMVATSKDHPAPPADILTSLPGNWIREPDAADVIAGAAQLGSHNDALRCHRNLSKLARQRLAAVPPDGNRFDIPRRLQLECHKRLKQHNATGSYGRVPTKGPARTLTTRCTTPACGAFGHPTEHRGLSLREAALLQTFPSNYQFIGNYGSIERQIGNAVPPRMTAAVLSATLGNT